MFLDRMQIYEDVVKVAMDELTDTVTKNGSHQLLESRGCVAITHLHHLAPECAKYCCEHCLMDVFQYDVYVFIHFRHIELWAICCPGHIITNDILVREWGQSLTVLSFCSHKLKTVCSLPFFFSMQSIGTTWCVPLQVSTTALWCISQFSERVPHGNALGISAVGSGYASWDQSEWSCGLLPR